jgi:hypothetical protein
MSMEYFEITHNSAFNFRFWKPSKMSKVITAIEENFQGMFQDNPAEALRDLIDERNIFSFMLIPVHG